MGSEGNETRLKSFLVDFCVSLKILLQFVIAIWFCVNLIQIDYKSLLNIDNATKTNDSSQLREIAAARVSRPRPRIFCLIFTYAARHDSEALYGLKTWIRNCDRYLFVSDEEHVTLEPLVVHHGYRWRSMLLSFRYVYEYFGEEFDWLLKVNDDSFVVLENLRKMLVPHSPSEAVNFGCQMKDNKNQTYMHGAYVLSHEALRRLVELSFTNASICNLDDSPYDDEELSRCLRNVGVHAVDSRDAMGRQRFVPFPPAEYLLELEPEKQAWYTNRSYYEINTTTRAMSPEVILFSNINSPTMVTLYYYIYKLKIFGRKLQSRNVTELFERPIPRIKGGV